MSTVRVLYSVALVVVFAHLGLGQEAKSTKVAPIPSAILAAQKVFISNAGEDNVGGDLYSGAQDRCYNDFYRQVRALNRFELVAGPADADIVLEISMTTSAAPTQVMKGDTVGPGYGSIFRLRILDPKTQIVLWTFYERVDPAVLKLNRNKNFDNALKQIVSDLSNLTRNGPRP